MPGTESLSVEALFDALLDEGIFTIDDETGEVSTTREFERSRRVYHDTYMDVSDATYHRTVADVFGLDSASEAADRIDDLGVSRTEFVAYMALQSALEGYTPPQLAQMATMVTEAGPTSPVPDAVERLDDETYGAFVDRAGRAVVTVWKLFCEPCRAMKADLEDVLEAFPEGVAVGGLDGERCPAFREAYDVTVAPAVVLFEDGEAVDVITGRTDPDQFTERVTEAYDLG